MVQQDNMLNNVAKLSLLNLMGIFVGLVLTVFFIILAAHSLKYIKQFAVKIKVIVNRAEDKEMQLKHFNYQSRVDVQKNPTYKAMETVFKNEIKKSRSPDIINIMGAYMAKYDHLVYYPFRNRLADKVDLLKPKSTFYLMLIICSLCISWISTILLVSLLQLFYEDITTVTITVFILFTLAIAGTSSILSLLAINRFFRMYVITIKNAFKVDYGAVFVKLHQGGHQEYVPDNDQELLQIKRYQEQTKRFKQNQNPYYSNINMDTVRPSVINKKGAVSKEETQNINSTRKLLGDELDLTERIRKIADEQIQKMMNHSSIIQEQEHEEENYEQEEQLGEYQSYPNIMMKQWAEQQNHSVNGMQHTQDPFVKQSSPKGKSLKDLFPLQAHIAGMQHAPSKDKYIYIEDKHAIGDLDLLNNEAGKGENQSNTMTFMFMFAVILISVVFCCYLNYSFPSKLSKAVFYMFAGGIVGDLLGFRIFFLFLLSFLKYFKALIQGYRTVQHNKKRELRNLMKTAVKEMFNKKKSYFFNQFETPLDEFDGIEENRKQYNKLKGKDHEALESYYQTGNNVMPDAFERHDTSMKQFPIIEENKEDNEAVEMNADGNYYGSGKRDDEGDGQRIPIEGFKSNNSMFKSNLDNKSFEKTQTLAYHTQMPLINPAQQALSEKLGIQDDHKFENLMDKKQIVNELVDYNLLLLRKIYDAYEERAGRVLKQFREDKHNILRKRYMVPVVNPNYDYEKLLKEIEEQRQKKDNVEEDSVHLDGQTFCEDFEQQLMEHILEEASENLVKEPVEREMIDKFGNKIDKNRKDVQVVLPRPESGLIEKHAEEEIEEEDADEWSRKMKELAFLRAKKRRGEILSDQEEKRLVQLEKEEDLWRHKEIEKLEDIDNRNNEEDNSLKQFIDEEDEYRNRRIEDLLEQQNTKEGLNNEEKDELQMLLEWQNKRKQKMLDELRKKLANGTLTDEERKLLQQLEDEEWAKQQSELDRLRERLRNGEKLTDEEMKRLKELEALEKARLLKELEMLREKAKRGELTEEEKRRLAELEEWEKQMKLKELERLENLRLNELDKFIEELLQKGEENLTDEELLKLLLWRKEKAEIELLQMQRKGPPYTEEGIQDMNDQEDLIEKLEYDILMLKKKMGLLSESEEQRLKELETKFKMNDLSKIEQDNEEGDQNGAFQEEENPFEEQNMLNEQQQQMLEEQQKGFEEGSYQTSEEQMYSRITDQENFAELPPVEVMNNVSPKQKSQQEGRSPKNGEMANVLTPKSALKHSEVERVNSAKSGVRFQDEELLRIQLEQEHLRNMAMAQQLAEAENQRQRQLEQDQEDQKLQLQQQQENQNDEYVDAMGNTKKSGVRFQDEENQQQPGEEELKNQLENSQVEFHQNQGNIILKKQQHLDSQIKSARSKKSIKSRVNTSKSGQRSQRSINKSGNSSKGGIPSQKSFDRSSIGKKSANRSQNANSQKGASGKSTARKQQNQKVNNLREDDELDRMNMMSREKLPSEIEFGHDDLEAPGGAGMDGDESIYSHKTSTILDEEKVSFMHIEHLPNQDNASDDSFSEQDMVYYNKDDLTNYSKGLGLNKVKARQQLPQHQQQYYSENDKNDIQEVNEGEISDSGDSAYSLDDQGRRRRKRGDMGKGQIKHNDLETQSYNDNIDGRVKVDAWNLNYRGKKKKLKKKKIDDRTKKRMNDLQSIYGVDARTLAGLQKGQFPKGAAGKGKDGLGASRTSDMSFRSTQNTFQKQSNQGGLPLTSKKSFDGQSNMFSFGGQKSVMSKRWNDIESTLKGGLLNQSKISKNGGGGRNQSHNKGNVAKKLPMSGMKKLTATQQNFKKQKNSRQPGYLEEESKSDHSMGSGIKNNLGKQNTMKKNNGKRGYDSYSESDEGVNDQSAVFQSQDEDDREYIKQTRDNLNKQGQKLQMQNKSGQKQGGEQKTKQGANYGMNDDNYHSESDEGVNDGNINFEGNDQDYLFKKRAFGEQSEMRSQSKNQFKQRVNKKDDSRYRSDANEDDLQMEDLEAQDFGGNGKKKTGKITSKIAGKKVFTKSSDEESAKRFQSKQFQNGKIGQKMKLDSEFNSEYEINSQMRKNEKSAQKPPLTGQKRQASSRRTQRDEEVDEDQMRLNNLYGDPYNINGHIHPGVSTKYRNGLPGHGYTDTSDQEEIEQQHVLFNKGQHQSDQDISTSQKKKSNQFSQSQAKFNRNGSTNNLLDAKGNKMQKKGSGSGQQNRRHRSNGGNGSENDSYIVGPESNHSMVRSRDQQNRQGRNNNHNNNNNYHNNNNNNQGSDDQYSIIHRDRETVEDLEANGNNQFAKKRKIKRAAHSTNQRDLNNQKLQQKRQERLRRKQMEAENALLSGLDEEEAKNKNIHKTKKKKQQKDWVRKEVNYWLDYDSPYAEYLVARFREWSPQVKGPQSRGGGSRQGSTKYNEVSHLYNVKANETNNSNQKLQQQTQQNYNSKPSSKSPQKKQKNQIPRNQRNQVAKKSEKKQDKDRNNSKSDNEMVWNQPFQSKQINNLFAEDFEEN